jgi:hypothetical protein
MKLAVLSSKRAKSISVDLRLPRGCELSPPTPPYNVWTVANAI